jgi:nucleoside 2-deoxyribosyltransferase
MRKGHFKVYLAGPISGLTYDEGQDWRQEFTQLMPEQIQCYSPLRAKDYLREHGILEQSYSMHTLSSDRGINTRDHFDCSTSDLIIANLLGATRISIGTVMEIAWAFAYRKPLVVIMEPEGNVHDHPMTREAFGFRVSSLDEAAIIVPRILLP